MEYYSEREIPSPPYLEGDYRKPTLTVSYNTEDNEGTVSLVIRTLGGPAFSLHTDLEGAKRIRDEMESVVMTHYQGEDKESGAWSDGVRRSFK